MDCKGAIPLYEKSGFEKIGSEFWQPAARSSFVAPELVRAFPKLPARL
jgi:hypothetical protein